MNDRSSPFLSKLHSGIVAKLYGRSFSGIELEIEIQCNVDVIVERCDLSLAMKYITVPQSLTLFSSSVRKQAVVFASCILDFATKSDVMKLFHPAMVKSSS